MIAAVPFYILAVLMLVSSLWVVFSKNLVHSAVALFFTFLGMVGMFLLLRLEFLAFVQLFLFVGAISILILFSLMMLKEYHIKRSNPHGKYALLGGIIASIFFLTLSSYFFLYAPLASKDIFDQEFILPMVGKQLLQEFVFPFELISVVLVAALIGAVVLVKKEEQ